MIKLKSLIKEVGTKVYDYGCVMLDFDFQELEHIHSLIDEAHVYNEDGFGLEKDAHVTLLYGLHDSVTPHSVENVINGLSFGLCTLQKPSLFYADDYEVLKFDVVGEGLHTANEALKGFPYTSNFNEYKPHLTIGYMRRGIGEKYCNILTQSGQDVYHIVPTHASFSEPNGKKHKMKISII